jgi:hypothetical protein
MGMLSYPAIKVSHDGQCDPGRTTDSPLGSRQITTFAKLPKRRPKSAMDTAKSQAGIGTALHRAGRQRFGWLKKEE